MISLLLLVLTIVLSALVVRIGAIALELTGLPEDQASFQSLSAFSGTGYTTKEAEFVLSHPQRRKIICALIILGSAGVISTIATLGSTLLSSRNIARSITRTPVHSWMPVNLPQFYLLAAILGFFFIYRLTHKPAVARLLKEIISAALLNGKWVKPVSFSEALVNGNGFGVFQIEITRTNPLAGKTIAETNVEEYDIRILYVNRMSESINFPPPKFKILEGDMIAVFGPVTAINDYCCDIQAVSKGKKDRDALLPLLEPAPAFALKDQNGREVRLEDFKGRKNLILVFYPKDKSFFCTAQLRDLSQALDDIRSLDTEVVAINQESQVSHASFCDASGLKFSLLSDSAKETCKTYKTLMLGGLLVDRTVYIIDKQGRIRYAARGKPSITEMLGILRTVTQGR